MIAPIFLGQDDTTIDGNGRRSLKPMYMTCGNLRVQKRNQKWANTCVGYIPKPNKNHRPSNMSKEQWKRDKRQMFHDAMAEMLAPVRPQASNFRRVLQCPGSPRFHSQKAVRWLPVTGGDRGGALHLHFPRPMARSASADGEVPGF